METSLPYFFEPQLTNQPGLIHLNAETSKHCIQVLRMQIGHKIQLTNGKGLLATAQIVEADKKNTTVNIEEVLTIPAPEKKISIAAALLKNTSRYEWFLEKATEFGVTEIIPLLTKRTENQKFKEERFRGILVAAMLQSKQSWLPNFSQPLPFQELIDGSSYPQKLIAHCLPSQKKNLLAMGPFSHAQILIGPEGDFTPEEIQNALSNQYQAVDLGPNRLRTETAAILSAALMTQSF